MSTKKDAAAGSGIHPVGEGEDGAPPSPAPLKHHPLGPSALIRRLLCPGSLRGEEGLPERESPEAARGTAIHQASAGEEVDLSPADEATLEEYTAFTEGLLKEAGRVHGRPATIERETTLQYRVCDDEPYGTADFLAIYPDGHAVVVDLKTHRGGAPDGQASLQLAAYALGAWDRMRAPRSVHAVAFYPGAARAETVLLDSAQETHWRRRIGEIMRRARRPDAPRTPSPEACKYCRAFASERCPESLRPLELRHLNAAELTDERAVELLPEALLCEQLARVVKAKATEALAEGRVTSDLYEVRERPGSRRLRDPLKASEALVDYVPLSTLVSASSVSLTRLQEAFTAVYSRREDCSKKDALAELNRRIEPYCESGKPVRTLHQRRSKALEARA